MSLHTTAVSIVSFLDSAYRRALAIVPRQSEAPEAVTADMPVDEHEIGIGDVVWVDTRNLVGFGMPAGIIGNVEAFDGECALVRFDTGEGFTFSRYLNTVRMTVLVAA